MFGSHSARFVAVSRDGTYEWTAISNRRSPIWNIDMHSALSMTFRKRINSNTISHSIDKDECIRMFQIADWRWQIANTPAILSGT
jgi:hypothetical protein